MHPGLAVVARSLFAALALERPFSSGTAPLQLLRVIAGVPGLQPSSKPCIPTHTHNIHNSSSSSCSSSPGLQGSVSMSSKPGGAARVWEMPQAAAPGPASSRLMLYNSLVDEKVPFVPAAGEGSTQISWYTCGPTVYDSAHMGHARNYVSLDIVRRVLEDYFQYNILFVMNVTDVDDKIILRARRNYLLQQYASSPAAGGKEVSRGSSRGNSSSSSIETWLAHQAGCFATTLEQPAQGVVLRLSHGLTPAHQQCTYGASMCASEASAKPAPFEAVMRVCMHSHVHT